jgi:hypothetical protein
MKRQSRSDRNRDARHAALQPPSFWPALSRSAPLAVALAVMTAAMALPSPSGAATAWRCGNAYADKPCPDGKALDIDDARSVQDRRAADEATRRVAARADAMERDRLRAEQTAAARSRSVILPDHRVAEARAREASRRVMDRSARLPSNLGDRSSRSGGRQQVAAGDGFAAQARQPVKR